MDLPPIGAPIVLAPMAGGIGTPGLVAAVSGAGGLGVLPAGYLTAARFAEDIAAVRGLTDRPFGVNLFVPAGPSAERRARAEQYVDVLSDWARAHDAALGEPSYTDDEYDEKLSVVVAARAALASFTFGLPPAHDVAALHDAGVPVVVTVNNVAEAYEALDLDVDGLVAQGWEAGAHRGGWRADSDERLGLVPLLEVVLAVTDRPVLAAGGIASGRGVAAVIAMGAWAAMLGTAFIRSRQAAAADAHAGALSAPGRTVMTRAFTGKQARSLENAFTREFGQLAPDAYPEIHRVTTAMRGEARRHGDVDGFHLWAGQSHALAKAVDAADLVGELADDAAQRLAATQISASPAFGGTNSPPSGSQE